LKLGLDVVYYRLRPFCRISREGLKLDFRIADYFNQRILNLKRRIEAAWLSIACSQTS